MSKPNILYIHSHDTGRYVQPYGYAVPTPNIQALAEQGVLFRQAFSAAPTCSPSRAALLTGQCPHASGMRGLAHRGWFLDDYSRHIIHTLAKAGYTSALAGVQHVAGGANSKAADIGYDQVLTTSHDANEALAKAEAFLADPPDKPFFLSVGFDETHRPFPTDDCADDPRYVRPPAPVADTPETRRDMCGFLKLARRLDASIGKVLAALDAAGLTENTLVICTTDHGPAMPGMKCNLNDSGLGVMLIMRGPGEFAGGKVVDAMVHHQDIYPTLCELLEIDPPDWLEGTSMMPLLRGQAEQIHDAIFGEVTYHAAYEPMRSVRTPRWRYIRRYVDNALPVLPNIDDSAAKDVWLAAGWRDRPIAAEQLYDTATDPAEQDNLAADPAFAEPLAACRALLAEWMKRTNDPLLDGHVPPPKGAKVNPADGLSPDEPPIDAPDPRA